MSVAPAIAPVLAPAVAPSVAPAPAPRAPTLTALPLRAPLLAALIVLTIVTGLVVDIKFGVPGQIAVTLFVWSLLSWLCLRSSEELRVRLIACVWISGIGEIGASLVWGLYDYQFGNVPLFVPPGHALLYLLGVMVAQRLPPSVSAIVPLLAAPVVAFLAWSGVDTLSLALFIVFIAFMLFGAEKKLYATMFIIALAMELLGTALGNWTWREAVRATPLATLNPPLAAGVFYCLLDWLVGWRSAAFLRRSTPTPAPNTCPP